MPGDLWVGMGTPLKRWEIVRARNRDKKSDSDGEDSVPMLDKAAVDAARERDARDGEGGVGAGRRGEARTGRGQPIRGGGQETFDSCQRQP